MEEIEKNMWLVVEILYIQKSKEIYLVLNLSDFYDKKTFPSLDLLCNKSPIGSSC